MTPATLLDDTIKALAKVSERLIKGGESGQAAAVLPEDIAMAIPGGGVAALGARAGTRPAARAATTALAQQAGTRIGTVAKGGTVINLERGRIITSATGVANAAIRPTIKQSLMRSKALRWLILGLPLFAESTRYFWGTWYANDNVQFQFSQYKRELETTKDPIERELILEDMEELLNIGDTLRNAPDIKFISAIINPGQSEASDIVYKGMRRQLKAIREGEGIGPAGLPLQKLKIHEQELKNLQLMQELGLDTSGFLAQTDVAGVLGGAAGLPTIPEKQPAKATEEDITRQRLRERFFAETGMAPTREAFQRMEDIGTPMQKGLARALRVAEEEFRPTPLSPTPGTPVTPEQLEFFEKKQLQTAAPAPAKIAPGLPLGIRQFQPEDLKFRELTKMEEEMKRFEEEARRKKRRQP